MVAAIIAYNYPNQLALAKLAPALAAGCTVVLKGAPDTPLVTLALGELIASHTDIPAGVVNVLSAYRPRSRCRPDHQPRRRHGHVHRLDPDRSARSWPRPARRSSGSSSNSAASRRRSCSTTRDFDTAALFAAFTMVTPRRSGLRAHVAAAGAAHPPRRDRRDVEDQLRPVVNYGDPTDPKAPTWVR